jgi:hypothetical protein
MKRQQKGGAKNKKSFYKQ